jgi:hypothetical protein
MFETDDQVGDRIFRALVWWASVAAAAAAGSAAFVWWFEGGWR